MKSIKRLEYIWLDGYQPEPSLRSKIKVTKDETPPDWSFDGSSTQQAEGGSSEDAPEPTQEEQPTEAEAAPVDNQSEAVATDSDAENKAEESAEEGRRGVDRRGEGAFEAHGAAAPSRQD